MTANTLSKTYAALCELHAIGLCYLNKKADWDGESWGVELGKPDLSYLPLPPKLWDVVHLPFVLSFLIHNSD